jgi:hypothetical protein
MSLHKVEEGEGESAAGSLALVVEAPSLAGDREVLAGEAAGPEDGVMPVSTAGVCFATSGSATSSSRMSRLPCCHSKVRGTSAISPRLDPPSPARSAVARPSVPISACAPPSRPRMFTTCEVDDASKLDRFGET